MITVEVNKQQEEKPKDIFFQGNIVATLEGLIIMVTGSMYSEDFCGVVIKDSNNYSIGADSNYWRKEIFTQFTGTITITSK